MVSSQVFLTKSIRHLQLVQSAAFRVLTKKFDIREHSAPSGSSGTGLIRVKTRYDEAAFGFSVPHLWNKFPEYLRFSATVSLFNLRLKIRLDYDVFWPSNKLDTQLFLFLGYEALNCF